MPDAEVPHLGQLGQRVDVQNRHVWTVGAEDDRDPPGLHIGGDEPKTRARW